MLEKTADKLAEALLAVEDLDLLASLYVTSSLADAAPALQGTMRNLWQAEVARRKGGDVEALPLPDFAKWNPINLLECGPTIIAACEVAAISGEPTLLNFAFALLKYWFVQLAEQHCEAITA